MPDCLGKSRWSEGRKPRDKYQTNWHKWLIRDDLGWAWPCSELARTILRPNLITGRIAHQAEQNKDHKIKELETQIEGMEDNQQIISVASNDGESVDELKYANEKLANLQL